MPSSLQQQPDLSAHAASLVDQGRAEEALAVLDEMAGHGADDMLAQNTRGRALLELNRVEEALAAFRRAAELTQDDPAPSLNAGLALATLGRHAEALAAFDALLARWPGLHMARRQRGVALYRLGHHAEALAVLQRMLADWPDEVNLLIDRGNVQMAMDRYDAAMSSYTQAVAMAPDDAVAHYNLGHGLQMLERHAAAVEAFDRALQLDPGMTSARINRANSLRRLVRHLEAAADYRRVLEENPGNALALANLGKTMGEVGQRAMALEFLDRAVTADPSGAEIRWMRALATVPAVRRADEDLASLREDFATALAEYDRWVASVGDLPGVVNVGRPHPFFLAYQEANNRDLMAHYGAVCARVMGTWLRPDAMSPGRPAQDGPLRVGIVSAHVVNHSVWLAIVRGWLANADKARVEYHVFHLGPERDAQTDLAAQMAARLEHGVRGLRDWVGTIRDSAMDVLVYPEIGMDDLAVKLASLRLAPVQVAAWGHPETTGLPTIDAYVSAAALEPPGAQAHYTEKLVALPGLGCCYTPLPLPMVDPDLAALGIAADRPILLCPGTPFKYVPEYDRVYVNIARRAPDAQLVFFRQDMNPLLSDAVFARLGAAFAAAGLDFAAHARTIPWQRHAGFYGLMRRADLFLDTIGFSGFNTAIQALECGLPVVTMEGRFMRGRLASGILREMDMPELVAAGADGYADIVVRLLADPAARQAARQKIARNRARLFGDIGAVRAFEDTLHALCRGDLLTGPRA